MEEMTEEQNKELDKLQKDEETRKQILDVLNKIGTVYTGANIFDFLLSTRHKQDCTCLDYDEDGCKCNCKNCKPE